MDVREAIIIGKDGQQVLPTTRTEVVYAGSKRLSELVSYDGAFKLAAHTVTGTLTTQNIAPDTDNTRSIGTASLKYKDIYATSLHGALEGNADSATKVGHALSFGSKTFDGSAAITLELSDLATYTDSRYRINVDNAYGLTNGSNGITYDQLINAMGGMKVKQTPVSNPTASGRAISFVDAITQDGNGEITVTRKTVRDATASQSGVVTTTAQTFAGDKTFNDNIHGKKGVSASGICDFSVFDSSLALNIDGLLTVLGTAIGGTFTKTWDSVNKQWNYSFTSN